MNRLATIPIASLILTFAACNSVTEKPFIAVGDVAVTQDQFTQRYINFLDSSPLTDNLLTRHIFTSSLIDEILLLAWAEQSDEHSFDWHREYAEIRAQTLLNDLFRKEIKDQAKYSEEHLRLLFRWQNTRLHARHLYAPNLESAAAILERLGAGMSWEELAVEVFTDPVLAAKAGDLGFTEMGDLDPDFERVAYALETGVISKPVRTSHGYSVIQILEKEYDPLITERDYQRERGILKQIAWTYDRRRQIEQYTDSVRQLLQIDMPGKLPVEALLTAIRATGEFALHDADKILLTYTGTPGTMSMRMAIARLRQLSQRQIGRIQTGEDIVQALAGVLIQDRLLELADKLNLASAPQFQQELADTWRRYQITQSIQWFNRQVVVPEQEIQDWFADHPEEMQIGARYEIAEIVVASSDELTTIRTKLAQGAEFATLADQFSLRAADRGGYIGWGTAAQLGLDPVMLDAAQAGTIIGPVADGQLQVLIQVLDVRPAAALSLDQARPIIARQLQLSVRRRVFTNFVDSLRAQVTVSIDSIAIREMILTGV